jgi:hypothetical protein
VIAEKNVKKYDFLSSFQFIFVIELITLGVMALDSKYGTSSSFMEENNLRL